VAALGGAVFVTGQDRISRLTPGPGGALSVRSAPLPGAPLGLAPGAGGLLVAEAGAGRVAVVDPATLRVRRTLAAGSDPLAVGLLGGRPVAVSGTGGDLVALGRGAPVRLGAEPRGLAPAGGGALLVPAGNPGTLLLVRPS
jgi:hypothetical protein